MTNPAAPGGCALYRDAVRELLPGWRHRSGPEDAAAFRDFVLARHVEARATFGAATAAPDSAAAGALFVFAAGAFAFGQLDAAADILATIPPTANIRQLARVLQALLPGAVPDPLRDPEGVRDWLAAHPALSWDEAAGRYREG